MQGKLACTVLRGLGGSNASRLLGGGEKRTELVETDKSSISQYLACRLLYFTCEIGKSEALEVSYEDVGIDLGVTHFAALSDGEFIDNPRQYRRAEKRLQKLQEALSRKKRGSQRRKKAVQAVVKAHRKIRRKRQDFLHKQSRKLVNRYQVIVFEDLHTANLMKRPKPKQDEDGTYLPNGAAAKAGLNKSIVDAGWAMFVQYCTYKAAWAGRTVVQVDPKYTSQICSGCGMVVKKTLEERWHSCECGTELDRDTNAAINILRAGHKHSLVGTRRALGNCVEAPAFYAGVRSRHYLCRSIVMRSLRTP